jgi:hypothetical protein
MLRGKYWFKDGCVITVNSEHAVIARNRLVGWNKTRVANCFGPLTPDEIKNATEGLLAGPWRRAAVKYYQEQNLTDPRIWYIEKMGAIRVRENMFWQAKITTKTTRAIARAADFWTAQVGYGLSEFDILEFHGLDGKTSEISFASFAEKHPNDLSRFLVDARRNDRAVIK